MSTVPKKKSTYRSVTDLDVMIGNRLRECRLSHRISQEKLALDLGITFQQLQKYELGRNRISASRLIEICRILRVSLSQLLGEIGVRASSSKISDYDQFVTSQQGGAIIRAMMAIRDKRMRAKVIGIARQLADV